MEMSSARRGNVNIDDIQQLLFVRGERHRVNEDVIGLTLQEDDIGLSLLFLLRRNNQTMMFSFALAQWPPKLLSMTMWR
jgi:hypothetical protein